MRRSVVQGQFRGYRIRYFDLIASINGTRAISLVASEVLKDFPARLPAKSRALVLALVNDVSNALLGAVQQLKDNAIAEGQRAEPAVHIRGRGPLARATLQLMMAQSLSGRNVRDFNFSYRLRAQELVMLLAHFDAFMADSLRAICVREPNTLKRSSTLTWTEIMQCGSWDQLVTHLVEQQAYSFGWSSARQKIATLEKEFGLTICADNADLGILEASEQARHLVVHNNCRVNEEYNRRTDKNLKIGSLVRISRPFVDRSALAISMVAGDTFRAIARKFFAADDSTLTGVWQREATPIPPKEDGL